MKNALIVSIALATTSPAMAQTAPAPVSPAATPAAASQDHIRVSDVIPVGEDNEQRMTVAVMVNGQGPFQFIIDTGADRSVISRELAEKLALPQAGTATLHSMGGVDEVKTVKIARLQVSNNIIRDVKAPALWRKNIGADGLLGIDALKNQRIVLDFTAQTMTVEQANTREVREEVNETGTIVVTAKSRAGQLVLVDADANGEDVWVVVDTGGQNTVGNSALRRLMVKRTPVDGFKPVQLISVVGDRIPADYMIVGKMRIGGIQLNNAAVAFVDAHPFKRFGMTRRPSMLMGMEGLRSFRRVSIDFANRKVKFLMPVGASAQAAEK